MAKTASKTAVKEAKKAPTRASKASASTIPSIEKASEEALNKLKSLGIEQELQNDLEWCLGSYRADQNPVGLYAMVDRAIKVFEAEKSKKTKGVTAKFVSDLEKAVQNR